MSETPAQQLRLFAPTRTSDDVRVLVEFLRGKDWMTASSILEAWDWPDTESNKRYLRTLAQAACPDLISGQYGYRHVEDASPQEIHHFTAWMESQAKEMLDRANQVRKRAHQIVG
jgi:hypothetical protein